MNKKIKIEKGSGNVFEDLGFENATEEQAKADLARQINILIKRREWNQTRAAKALKLTQPKISLLQRGQLKNFSLEKLMRILNDLNQDIEIVVRDRGSRRKPGDIQVVLA